MQGRRSILQERNIKISGFGDPVTVFVLKDKFDNKKNTQDLCCAKP